MQLRRRTYGVPSTTRLLIACCVVVVVGIWGTGGFLAALSTPMSGRLLSAEYKSEASAWMETDAILVYGGSYSVLLKNLRFERTNAAPETQGLLVDLIYSNQSPFVVGIEQNSQIHAHVCNPAGACLDRLVDAPHSLMPGEARELTVDLGDLRAADRLAVLFTDRGGNVLGKANVLPDTLRE